MDLDPSYVPMCSETCTCKILTQEVVSKDDGYNFVLWMAWVLKGFNVVLLYLAAEVIQPHECFEFTCKKQSFIREPPPRCAVRFRP